MKLLTQENRRALPLLYSQENAGEGAIVHVKFFTPWTRWTWYATEFDGVDVFFGLVDGDELELGYWSLTELEGVSGPVGLKIERDMHWRPRTVGEVRAEIETRRAARAGRG